MSPWAIRALAALGAVALAVAEFLTLYRVRSDAGGQALSTVSTVSAGAHHSYALLPLAALALLLAWVLPRSRWPVPAALALLGLAALGIALLGDLPDVHRSGVLGTPATGLHNADTVAGPALYLEALGAIALLAAGAAGLILGPALRSRSAASGVPGPAAAPGSRGAGGGASGTSVASGAAAASSAPAGRKTSAS